MNIIFKRATLTIVALDGHDADCGLHGVSLSRNVPSIEIDGIRLIQTLGESHFNNLKQDGRTLERIGTVDSRDSSRLWRRRAWTMQEDLLSRRKIFLAEQQAFFTCSSARYSESGAQGGPPPSNDGQAFSLYTEDLTKSKAHHKWYRALPWPQLLYGDLSQWPTPGWWPVWRLLTESYSSKLSTDSTDRFLAFQGILSEQETAWRVKSVAGLPLDLLAAALLWQHGSRDFPTDPPLSERINQNPSWCWTGWTGPVYFRHSLKSALMRQGDSVFSSITEITILERATSSRLSYDSNGEIQRQQPAAGEPNQPDIKILPLFRPGNIVDHAQPQMKNLPGHSFPILSFEAVYIEGSSLHQSGVAPHLNLLREGHQVGYLIRMQASSVDRFFRGRCVLLGTSQRYFSCCHRGGYTPFNLHDGRWGFILLTLLAAFLMSGSFGVFLKFGARHMHYLVSFIISFLTLFVGFFLASLSLRWGLIILYGSGLDKIAHVVLVQEIWDGIYERCGSGEMTWREFQRAGPKMMRIKLA
jgi:hypothetical protein